MVPDSLPDLSPCPSFHPSVGVPARAEAVCSRILGWGLGLWGLGTGTPCDVRCALLTTMPTVFRSLGWLI
jgi:hypothetical protein